MCDCWFLVCNAATQLALQFQKELKPVVRSHEVVRRLSTELNGTPAMELVCLFDCLFVVIQPENPFFASRPGLEVEPPGSISTRAA